MKKFYITSEHIVTIEDYNEGEGDTVNHYTLEEIIIAKNWKEAVDEYFGNTLFLSFKLVYADVIDGELHFNSLVDAENMDATEDHIKDWKIGERELYNNHSIVTVYELSAVRMA